MDQPVVVAFWVTIAILAVVGVVRVMTRRRSHDTAFGAGGTPVVPVGSNGVTRTALTPRGVVYAAGEEWSARSATGREIAEDEPVRVVGQEGLTLVVEPGHPAGSAAE